MKMTMHIDEEVLERVMKITGAKTKTAAVELALTNMARRHKMKELFNAGLGMSPEELRNALDPASYPDWESTAPLVAEPKPPYGSPDPAR
jgi:Arc/MetJ family transcription regulator